MITTNTTQLTTEFECNELNTILVKDYTKVLINPEPEHVAWYMENEIDWSFALN